jgi:hypothetical protein
MDWIWSSRCLALSCTSTQSSNLKWAGGGGINSPRHQTSCWLKAAESSTVGWSDAMIFQASVHPMLLAIASTAHDHWQNCSDTMFWCTVRSSSAERSCGQNVSGSFHATVGSTVAHPSVHPLLKASSWRVSALFKLNHRIPMVPSNEPSVHPTLLSLWFLFSNSSDATRKGTVGSSNGIKLTPVVAQCTKCFDAMHRWYCWFIWRCLFPSFSSHFQLNILNMPLLIASKYIISPQFFYKQTNMSMSC